MGQEREESGRLSRRRFLGSSAALAVVFAMPAIRTMAAEAVPPPRPHRHCKNINWVYKGTRCTDGWWQDVYEPRCSVCGRRCGDDQFIRTEHPCGTDDGQRNRSGRHRPGMED